MSKRNLSKDESAQDEEDDYFKVKRIRTAPETENDEYHNALKEGKFDKWIVTDKSTKFVQIMFVTYKPPICVRFLVPQHILDKEATAILDAAEKGGENEKQLLQAMCMSNLDIKELDSDLVDCSLDDSENLPKGKEDLYDDRIEDYELLTCFGRNRSHLLGAWKGWKIEHGFDLHHHLGLESLARKNIIVEMK